MLIVFGIFYICNCYRGHIQHKLSAHRSAAVKVQRAALHLDVATLLDPALGFAGDDHRQIVKLMRRSVPQALFEVGERAPIELRDAFAAARREWRISTDFARTLDVLRTQLGDPTADVVCETLLIAHELGGSDLGTRLQALADDRRVDVNSRKDAQARQAGVRFARRFVLVVPLGMAAAGSLIGTGRHAYTTPLGQFAVLVALALMGLCWVWAGRYLRLPEERRVFAAAARTAAVAR